MYTFFDFRAAAGAGETTEQLLLVGARGAVRRWSQMRWVRRVGAVTISPTAAWPRDIPTISARGCCAPGHAGQPAIMHAPINRLHAAGARARRPASQAESKALVGGRSRSSHRQVKWKSKSKC
eukprot:COSAG01_NODE_5010_length_4543_cov_12.105536_3_plen_123_part_00